MNEQTTAQIELPKYKCHKVVHALKIAGVVDHTMAKDPDVEPGGILTFADHRFARIVVDAAWMERFQNTAGREGDLGYYVVYADGYKSWSPTKAFEEGYTLIG